jgi:hypothetical protein
MPFDGTMNPIVLELQTARGRLIERGWCQDSLLEKNGEVCLLGALGYQCSSDHALTPAARAIAQVLRLVHTSGSIALWNDDPRRTKAEVLAVLDQAIAAESARVLVPQS